MFDRSRRTAHGHDVAVALECDTIDVGIIHADHGLHDAGGAALVVSQFTLYGDTRRGNRPSFVAAASSELAEPLYERFCDRTGARRGVFGAHMAVELLNDGPVTLLIEA